MEADVAFGGALLVMTMGRLGMVEEAKQILLSDPGRFPPGADSAVVAQNLDRYLPLVHRYAETGVPATLDELGPRPPGLPVLEGTARLMSVGLVAPATAMLNELLAEDSFDALRMSNNGFIRHAQDHPEFLAVIDEIRAKYGEAVEN